MKLRYIQLGVVLLISQFSLAQEEITPLMASWPKYLEHKANTPFRLNWISLGPVINSARVDAVQCDPTRPGTWYAGFGSGNLWKTTDHGLSWKPVFEDQPALSIGDFTLAPSNPDIIYLGTGEYLKKPRNFTLPGVGVFRSDDGGQTWRHLGLEKSWHIAKIKVHPQKPDIAFVAVLGHLWTPNSDRGIYRTLDGGKSWEKVLFVNEKTGANDIVISPSNPDVLYASMWENYPGICGKESAVYKSTDVGSTWQRLSGGLPDGDKTGRTGLAVSWQNPDKVYAFVDNLNRGKDHSAECYKTVDGGLTWKRTHPDDLMIYAGIGWYFSDCAINPKDDEEIYLLGIRMAHSNDGGQHFDLVGGDVYHIFPSPAVSFHLDQCDIWINPLNPDELAAGNDGGFYYSYNKGKSWMHYNNLPTGEFYDISADNQVPYNVYGGVQDDASVFGPAREWNPRFADKWKYIWVDAWSGGDGCYTMADPGDPNIIYSSSQNGGIFRKDMAADRSVFIQPQFPRGTNAKLNFNFIAPYLTSRYQSNVLYHAGNYVFKSLNKGDKWELISPDISKSSNAEKISTAAGALAESPMKAGLLVVGTDKGAAWITEDDGKSWIERSEGLPNRYIRSIVLSRFSQDRIYLAMTGINEDDLESHLFVSEDLGKNWTSITADLPDETVNCVAEDPINENFLYAGLHRGVFISVNRGKSWSLLGCNMSATVISDLVFQERELDLIAGTHGRGIYKMNLKPVHAAFDNGFPLTTRLFAIPDLTAPWSNDTHRDINEKSVQKTEITWWQETEGPAHLQVMQGIKRIWETDIAGTRGFNQIRWDGVVKEADVPETYFFQYKTYINPGTYIIKLSGKGFSEKQEFTVSEAKKNE
ncbi:MAG: hypothetical protein D4R64_17415 [Porphyromonadaceae bacterium]|nr:MAG: hypothetical protein D4R64_17415 [Porphyromonadaceae bacterium]